MSSSKNRIYKTETINSSATYWHAEISSSPFGLCLHEHEFPDTLQELSMLSQMQTKFNHILSSLLPKAWWTLLIFVKIFGRAKTWWKVVPLTKMSLDWRILVRLLDGSFCFDLMWFIHLPNNQLECSFCVELFAQMVTSLCMPVKFDHNFNCVTQGI